MNKLVFFIFFIFFIFLGVFFYKNNVNVSYNGPINLNKNNMCAVDSMIIVNYNGPKAQILWKDGTRSFYCEVKEAFYDNLDKVKSKQIKSFFVQDFSGLSWGSYTDKWVLASNVVYVIDSKLDGAMGVTYVPFSNLDGANDFCKLYGGKLISFNQINLDVLANSSNLLRNRIIH